MPNDRLISLARSPSAVTVVLFILVACFAFIGGVRVGVQLHGSRAEGNGNHLVRYSPAAT